MPYRLSTAGLRERSLRVARVGRVLSRIGAVTGVVLALGGVIAQPSAECGAQGTPKPASPAPPGTNCPKPANPVANFCKAKPAGVSFATQIMPIFDRFGCNAIGCHGATQGKAGLKFSMFGAEADADWQTLTHGAAGRYLDRVQPEESLLLQKISGALPHAGPRKIDSRTPEYQTLRNWIAQGALRSAAGENSIVSLRAGAVQEVLKPGESCRLVLTAAYSDGTTRDVSAEAIVQLTDRKVASASGGTVKALEPGETIAIARFLRKTTAIRIVVPRANPPASAPDSANKIDDLVNAKLKLLGLSAAPVCSDSEFLRRVFLRTTGVLPNPEEVRAFLADASPAKRAKWIDRLLEREEFADFQALKWGDILRIKSEFPVRVWPKGVETYYRWMRESIAHNKPYDQFVREMLLSGGSNFHDGASNFYRALPSKDPRSIGETVALVFMGARLGCAHCHAHPTEDWATADALGMGAFFAKIGYKATLEWKEEIVFFNPKGVLRYPRTREVVKPKFLGGATLDLDPEEDPRVKFADWLTAPENPWFGRAIANRIWFWLFTRGIVQEPDDLRPTNPPENPELLDFLARELAGHRYDLKHLYRLILNSRAWQRSSSGDSEGTAETAHFGRYPVVRLGAEQLSDAICRVTETSEKIQSIIPEPFTFLPPGHRATQLSDGNIGVPFLELFGRPQRDTPYESERNNDTSLWQALYLLNSDQLEGKIGNGERVKRLLAAKRTDEEIVDEFYLAALSRPPAPEEKRKVLEYLTAHKNRAQAIRDFLWALLNTKEFLFVR